jgi:hypothetical protein
MDIINMLKKVKIMKAVVAAFVAITVNAPGVSWSHSGNDLDDHWLAAACTQVPDGGRLTGIIRDREHGVAIGPRTKTSLVLYCNVEADLFHNFIQIIAEDNSPNVEVTATFFQQDINNPGLPMEIVSVTTTDQPGLQVAGLFFDPAVEPDEFNYIYYIRIEVIRSSSDPVWVYSVSLRDVL